MSTVEREIAALREWRHAVPNQLLIPIQDELVAIRQTLHHVAQSAPKDPPKSTVLTMRDFWVAFGTVGATVTVLRVLGLLRELVS